MIPAAFDVSGRSQDISGINSNRKANNDFHRFSLPISLPYTTGLINMLFNKKPGTYSTSITLYSKANNDFHSLWKNLWKQSVC
jgi:hypothetical protein